VCGLSREAASTEIAQDEQHNDDDNEDPKPRWHVNPFVGSTAILRRADPHFNDSCEREPRSALNGFAVPPVPEGRLTRGALRASREMQGVCDSPGWTRSSLQMGFLAAGPSTRPAPSGHVRATSAGSCSRATPISPPAASLLRLHQNTSVRPSRSCLRRTACGVALAPHVGGLLAGADGDGQSTLAGCKRTGPCAVVGAALSVGGRVRSLMDPDFPVPCQMLVRSEGVIGKLASAREGAFVEGRGRQEIYAGRGLAREGRALRPGPNVMIVARGWGTRWRNGPETHPQAVFLTARSVFPFVLASKPAGALDSSDPACCTDEAGHGRCS
jgi:hypothetical protein